MKIYDVIIIGAGAAGLFCAWQSALRGLKVLVLEKQSRPGLKILISGGGRCNFTNRSVEAHHYVSQNPHFCKSALAGFKPEDFIRLVESHHIPYHEKHQGQLFCDRSSKDILNMLLQGCLKNGVTLNYNISVKKIEKYLKDFVIFAEGQSWRGANLVLATGGLSYPRLGSSDFGYRIAEQFGHSIIATRPALTPLICSLHERKRWQGLSGISCLSEWNVAKNMVKDELLITHTGFSGPAVLRISNYWQEGVTFNINFLPTVNIEEALLKARLGMQKVNTKNFLAQFLPKRLAEFFCQSLELVLDIGNLSSRDIKSLKQMLHDYPLSNFELAGFDKAEVTAGGINTCDLSSQSMESKKLPGLYFIGELLDVTGDLGGYNFQWAWASAFAAARKMSTTVPT
ncbi:MAG: NAD(P)/FAD-dependent oxidoreductase [Deltaproteobacteria bacterium]|nr:NAD(P)/FAD-dependent oxidoreductase [Deltaproteobacteria bacterium]